MKPFLPFLIFCFLLLCCDAYAQPGTVDSSFGVDGKVMTSDSTGYPLMTHIALQSDEKIVVAGHSDKFIFISRYLQNGAIDSSFGSNGTLKHELVYEGSSGNTFYFGILKCLVQKDKKITIGLQLNTNELTSLFVLFRYLPSGTLDSSFGVNGEVFKPISIRELSFQFMNEQEDGKIIMGGFNDGLILVRFNSNGSADSSFGINGIVIYNNPMFPYNLTILKDGKYLMQFWQINWVAEKIDMGVCRLLPNGEYDSAFGNNGTIIADIDDNYGGLATFKNEDFLVAGISYINDRRLFILEKYTREGKVDSSFANNGKAVVDTQNLGLYQRYYGQIFIQEDGKIISAHLRLLRLTKDAKPDSSFGVNGKAEFYIPAEAVVVQNDEKMVTLSRGYVTYIHRFNGDSLKVNIEKDIKIKEGNSGTKKAIFTIQLNHSSPEKVKIDYTTVDGSAKSGLDYMAASGTITFRPGKISKKVKVKIIGDAIAENDEKFFLQLTSPKKVSLGTFVTAKCIIENDDNNFSYSRVKAGVKNNESASLQIVPNPVTDVLKLTGLDNTLTSRVIITDNYGRELLSQKIKSGGFEWNAGNLASGIYYLIVISGNRTEKLKFIKQ